MNVRNLTAMSAALLLAPLASASAQFSVDQSFSPYAQNGAYLGNFTNSQSAAQGFTPTQNNSMGGQFTLGCFGAATCASGINITIGLFAGTPSGLAPSMGSALASASSTLSGGLLGDYTVGSVTWSPVAVTPGNDYFLYVITNATSYSWATQAGANQLGGRAYYFDVTQAPVGGSMGEAISFNANWEFAEYYDPQFGGSESAAPEPASLLLLGTGLAGLAAVTRRRRA